MKGPYFLAFPDGTNPEVIVNVDAIAGVRRTLRVADDWSVILLTGGDSVCVEATVDQVWERLAKVRTIMESQEARVTR